MGYVVGVHLLPATGEFTYDTIAYEGAGVGAAMSGLNTFFAPGGSKTDYSEAMDQLVAAHPECTTVALVCAWFANSLEASNCQIYPATTFVGGVFQRSGGAVEPWRVSSLDQNSSGLIALPMTGASFVYGGTPSDQSVIRCLRDLRARGFKTVFYPFLLMTASGFPWRGRITHSPDVTSAATSAASAFLGSAIPSQFTPDPIHLTVAYAGSPTDFTYRRMILHCAWLCAVAGGVDLFLIGSELRGLETIRGPDWTAAGTTDSSGRAIWDYPFVAGLNALANDVRAIFDSQGFAKDSVTLTNLIAYSADWSDWMGFQHPGDKGQWPHLDSLWANANIDIVGFDNYLPLSDWTTGGGGLDVVNWPNAAPTGAWPPIAAAMSGLGLTGAPTIYSLPYLKANIEGGEKFSWFYDDGVNAGAGLDPNGADVMVSRPEGDRLAQGRNAYSAGQALLANKQLRWWWNNTHQAIYDNGDGSGWAPHGPTTQWLPQSKSIAFIEYGVPSCDKGTNQPNVFFDSKSVESGTPYWSVWQTIPGDGEIPLRDDTLSTLALRAIYEYWNVDGNNATSSSGMPMVQFAFSCVWNWDARPFPVFPLLAAEWGDAGDWQAGNWLNGRGPSLPPVAASPAPVAGAYPSFPVLSTAGWSTHVKPRFDAQVADHVSGRSTRHSRHAAARYEVELRYDVLRSGSAIEEMQSIAGFFESLGGGAGAFWLAPPRSGRSHGAVARRRRWRHHDVSADPILWCVRGAGGGDLGHIHRLLRRRATAIRFLVRDPGLWSRGGVCDRARRRRRGVGRLRRAMAVPLRGRRARFRGIHGHALRAQYGQTHNGETMTAPPSFPTPPGQGWSVHKQPTFATIVATHVSGREVRDALYQNPIWRFELCFDALASDSASYPGLGAQSLQSLMGLFLQCQGQWGTFLYTDPTDNAVYNQVIANGDGAATSFTLARALGGFLEPVGRVTAVSQVTISGAVQASGWSLVAPNALVFTSPPAIGAAIGASFNYAFQCRFDDDTADFEEVMQNLWTLQSLKFRSVRAS
jgi:hypothetical protein